MTECSRHIWSAWKVIRADVQKDHSIIYVMKRVCSRCRAEQTNTTIESVQDQLDRSS